MTLLRRTLFGAWHIIGMAPGAASLENHKDLFEGPQALNPKPSTLNRMLKRSE